jgi:hypothetical protein
MVQTVRTSIVLIAMPAMAGAASDASDIKKGVARDLNDIASETSKNNRSSDATERTAAATTLKVHLRWKPFEEI